MSANPNTTLANVEVPWQQSILQGTSAYYSELAVKGVLRPAWADFVNRLPGTGLSDHLMTRLTEDARAALAERLMQDLTAQVERGEMQALVGLGRIEMEIRSPARLQEAALWFTLAAAFEMRHAEVLREVVMRDLEPAQRLSVQARAGADFSRWCGVLATKDRPRSCAAE